MSIGLVCQYLEPIVKRSGNIEYKNITNEKSLQYKQYLDNRYSKEYIEQVWVNNCNSLLSIIKRIFKEGYRSFRLSSSLFPLFDLNKDLLQASKAIPILKEIGNFVLANNVRITTHPDQFVLLSSNKEEVNNNSISILNHYGWMFDSMDLPKSPYFCINIHGGVKGNSNILIKNIDILSESVRSRLTLENDERSYNVLDLYNIYKETNIPIVFDCHHHEFNTSNLSLEEGLDLAIKTWNGIKPMTHLSNTEPENVNKGFSFKRKHSNYVHYISDVYKKFNNDNVIDIEFEFKMKNFAIKKAIKDFELIL